MQEWADPSLVGPWLPYHNVMMVISDATGKLEAES